MMNASGCGDLPVSGMLYEQKFVREYGEMIGGWCFSAGRETFAGVFGNLSVQSGETFK